MRNVSLDSVDAIDRPVLAIGTDYPPDTLLPRTATGARSSCTAPRA
jgi:hypothetical protein